MNLGSFFEYENYLRLIRIVQDNEFKRLYFDIKTFKYVESEIYAFLLVWQIPSIIHIPLPTINNIRKSYKVGDYVYYLPNKNTDCFVKRKIVLKYKNYYEMDDCYESRAADQLIPYNWHILHINCRKAIEAWLYCSRRLNLYLDLRKLIAGYIWEMRNEYEWDFS